LDSYVKLDFFFLGDKVLDKGISVVVAWYDYMFYVSYGFMW